MVVSELPFYGDNREMFQASRNLWFFFFTHTHYIYTCYNIMVWILVELSSFQMISLAQVAHEACRKLSCLNKKFSEKVLNLNISWICY